MNRLVKLMETNSLSNYRLAKELGISEGTIRAWKKGTSIPKGKNLAKLAEYFCVHPSWLLYGDEKFTPTLDNEILQISKRLDTYIKKHPKEINRLKALIDAFTTELKQEGELHEHHSFSKKRKANG